MTNPAIKRRDWFVDSTVRAATADGTTVNAEAVARAAAHDLSVLDRAVSLGEIDLNPPKRTGPRKPVDYDPVKAKAAQHGQTLTTGSEGAEDNPLVIPTGTEALRLFAMDRRIRILCKPVPGYRYKTDAQGQVDEPLGNACEYPAFANLLFMHSMGFARGIMSYKGLNYEDRKRKYNRAVQDICDRSDAVVGFPWWVK